ncbi:MAG: hypothetical protein R3Y07_02090 [Eubacteriales bacterium]
MEKQQYNVDHCNLEITDYVGQILIMKPESLYEEYQNTEYQLWVATHGTGCFGWSGSFSDTVHAICLTDQDYGAFGRSDFLGVAKDEILPDWAKEKRDEILDGRNHQDPIER